MRESYIARSEVITTEGLESREDRLECVLSSETRRSDLTRPRHVPKAGANVAEGPIDVRRGT